MIRRRHCIFRLPHRQLELGARTLLMGILNVTPDSFSDGGLFLSKSRALERALEIQEEGADLLDIGGESTRPPHAEVLPAREELRRILPVLEGLAGKMRIPISVDTYKAEVAEAALEAGAEIINDIGGLRFHGWQDLQEVVRRHQAGLVLMHSRGSAESLHGLSPLKNILRSVKSSLSLSLQRARQGGIPTDRLILDPGLGFGKSAEDNLHLLRKLDTMAAFRLPLLVGASRKSFIGKVLDLPTGERVHGSLACAAAAIFGGAHIVRVHDVRPSLEVARMCDAILQSGFER